MLWEIMLWITGAFCLVYYSSICIFLRKWDSTFSRFWLAAGILLPVFWFWEEKFGIPTVLLWGAAAVGILTVFTFCIILGACMRTEQKTYDYLLVLGAQVRGTKITDSLKRRLDRAFRCAEKHPETKIIVSGGQGKGEEVTEAAAMADYLCSRGLAKDRIFLEDRSKTTQQNLRFSAQFLEKEKDVVGIVSNNFHLYRACLYAKKQGYQNAYPVAASCHPLLFVNYMMREVLAVWKLWLTQG